MIEVLLTVYDRECYLESCIESVLAQTLPVFTLTILDDGNSAGVARIVSKFSDSRIRRVGNSPRKGVALSVFDAIKSCNQKFFSIINDDDLWEPRFLEVLVGALNTHESACLAFCNHQIIDANGIVDGAGTDVIQSQYRRSGLAAGLKNNLQKLVVMHNAIPIAMGSVIRTASVNVNLLDRLAGKHYDYWLSLVLANSSNEAFFVPDYLTRYRIHEKMESAQKSPKMLNDIIAVHRMVRQHDILSQWRWVFRRRLVRLHLSQAREQLKFGFQMFTGAK